MYHMHSVYCLMLSKCWGLHYLGISVNKNYQLHPYEVNILNEYKSTLHFVESQEVSLIAMVLPKIAKWEGLEVSVNCNLAKRDCLGKIMQQHKIANKKICSILM